MVAGGTGHLWLDHELLLELETEILSGFDAKLWVVGEIGLRVVIEVIDFFERAEIFLRGAVALEAPAHGVRLRLVDDFHFVHVAVAALAGDAAVHVGGVVEINVVWGFVDPHPFDGFAIIARVVHVHRFMERSELGAVALDVLVTIPTGATRRDIRVAGDIHE